MLSGHCYPGNVCERVGAGMVRHGHPSLLLLLLLLLLSSLRDEGQRDGPDLREGVNRIPGEILSSNDRENAIHCQFFAYISYAVTICLENSRWL